MAPEGAAELVRRARCADKTLLLKKGGRHQLFQDTAAITQEVMRDLLAWLSAHATPAAKKTL